MRHATNLNEIFETSETAKIFNRYLTECWLPHLTALLLTSSHHPKLHQINPHQHHRQSGKHPPSHDRV